MRASQWHERFNPSSFLSRVDVGNLLRSQSLGFEARSRVGPRLLRPPVIEDYLESIPARLAILSPS